MIQQTITVVCGAAVLLIMPAALPCCAWSTETAGDEQGVELFESKIRPVLVAKCYSCHAATAKEIMGGLQLDYREGIRKGGDSGPAVVPGKVDESLIIEALRHESFEMPPKEKLPAAVINDFIKWIELGAPTCAKGSRQSRAVPLTWRRAESSGRFVPCKTCQRRP